MSDDSARPRRTKPRITVREALRLTIEDCGINAGALAERVGVPPAALSEFRNGRRDINTRTLQALLDGLKIEEFVYLLEIMGSSVQMLSWPSDRMPSSQEEYAAFFALISSFCSRCTKKEQLDLLSAQYRAFSQNSNLDDPPIDS